MDSGPGPLHAGWRRLAGRMGRTLYGLRMSPWTERARWALDHHGVAYTYHEHLPMLGEVLLRLKARRKKATVPLLADGDRIVMGSFEIAKHAEGIGRGAALFPSGTDVEMRHWADVAERLSRAGRTLLMERLSGDRVAQADLLPGAFPSAVRTTLAPMAGLGLRFIASKHEIARDVGSEIEHVLRPLLQEVQERVSGRTYVFASLSFADIALASCMQVLRARPWPKVPEALLDAWTNESLANEFEPLLKWRDAIYDKHR